MPRKTRKSKESGEENHSFKSELRLGQLFCALVMGIIIGLSVTFVPALNGKYHSQNGSDDQSKFEDCQLLLENNQ